MDGSAEQARQPAGHGDATPGFLFPKRRRRGYGDRTVPGAVVALPSSAAGGAATVNHAIQAMLNAHALDWSRPQLANSRTYLLSPTGRFQRWLEGHGVGRIEELTTDRIAGFLAAVADRTHGPGLKASTVAKYRGHFRALARFQAATPGYGASLHDIDRIPMPRMPAMRYAPVLSRIEERAVVDACSTERDRLIVELFLATGVRVSEMAALTVPSALLSHRPPRIVVSGSVHDPDCTKNRRPRQVPFRSTYNTLPRRLNGWITTHRDPYRVSPRQELFLTVPDARSRDRMPTALTLWGFESLCQRLSVRAGVHFSPHMLRHTWATRLVDAGVKPMHLMEAGGWSSIEMVRRYYSANDEEVLAVLSAARA